MSDDEITAEDVLRIAKAVARRYANRCWWADPDDVTSEASVAVLQAKRTWDPTVGVPFDGYAQRAAALRVRTYLWGESSPVTGGLHDPKKNIANVRRAGLMMRTAGGHDAPEMHSERPELMHTPDPAAQLDDANWRLRVRRRLRALARDGRDGELATEVLVRGRKPAEVIAESGRDVYGAVHLVRRKVRSDRRMYNLWRMRHG